MEQVAQVVVVHRAEITEKVLQDIQVVTEVTQVHVALQEQVEAVEEPQL